MKPRITVVDYGLGNLHSVIKALDHVGAEVVIAEHGDAIEKADRVILPGVGAYEDGMSGLRQRNQAEALKKFAASGRPLLGICLGAQLLLSKSEEFGVHEGLDIIHGNVVRIPQTGVKVPHVGWKPLESPEGTSWSGTLLEGIPGGTWAYFVHSYHMEVSSKELFSVVKYGDHQVTAAVRNGEIVGFQFHPEKSGLIGLEMLKAFCNR